MRPPSLYPTLYRYREDLYRELARLWDLPLNEDPYMLNTDDLHYSLIHPETIKAEYQARGCWLVVTSGLCDSEVGYSPGVLVCAPAKSTDPAFRCFAPKDKPGGLANGPWFWNVPECSRYFPSETAAFQHPDWFGTAEYGRHGSKLTDEALERVEAGGCAPPIGVRRVFDLRTVLGALPVQGIENLKVGETLKFTVGADGKPEDICIELDIDKVEGEDAELDTNLDAEEPSGPWAVSGNYERKTDPPEPTSDEIRVTSGTGGAKGSKQCQMGWIPAFVMEELGNLYGLGAKKYGDPLNFTKGYDWSLSYNALLRHCWAWMGGESHDPKDGQHHLASVIWHAIALQYFERHHPEFDDRLCTREGVDVGIAVEIPVGVTEAPGTGWTQTSRITETAWAGADETCFRNADEVEGAPV